MSDRLVIAIAFFQVERIKAAGDAPLPPEFGLDPDDTIGYPSPPAVRKASA